MHKSGKKRPTSRLSKLKLSTKKRKTLTARSSGLPIDVSTDLSNKENVRTTSESKPSVADDVLKIHRRFVQTTASEPYSKELFHVSKPLHLYEPHYIQLNQNTVRNPPNSPEIDLLGSARRKPVQTSISHDSPDLLHANVKPGQQNAGQDEEVEVRKYTDIQHELEGLPGRQDAQCSRGKDKLFQAGSSASPAIEFEFELEEDERVEDGDIGDVNAHAQKNPESVHNDVEQCGSKDGGIPGRTHEGNRRNSSSFEFEIEDMPDEDEPVAHKSSTTFDSKQRETTETSSRRESGSFEFEIDDMNDEEEEHDSHIHDVFDQRVGIQSEPQMTPGTSGLETESSSPMPTREAIRRDSSTFEFVIEETPRKDHEPQNHSRIEQPPPDTTSLESNSPKAAKESRAHHSSALEVAALLLSKQEDERQGEAAGSQKSQRVQSASTFASPVSGKGPFICVYCYTDNDDGVACLLCGKPRPPVDRKWECASCTTDNLPTTFRCSTCDMRRTANCKLSEVGFSQSSDIVYEKVLSDSYDSDVENTIPTKAPKDTTRNVARIDTPKETTAKEHTCLDSDDSFECEEFELRMDDGEEGVEHSCDRAGSAANCDTRSAMEPVQARDEGYCSSANEEFDLSMDNGDEHDDTDEKVQQDGSNRLDVGSDQSSVGNETFELSMEDDHMEDYSFSQAHTLCNICHQVSQGGSILLECSKCSIHVHASCYRVSPTELARSSTFTCTSCKPRGVESQNHYITVCDDDVEEIETQASRFASTTNRAQAQASSSSAPELIDLAASPMNHRTMSDYNASRSMESSRPSVSNRDFEHFVPLSQLPPHINRAMFKTKFAAVNFSRLAQRAEKLKDMEGKAPAKAKRGKGKRGGYKSRGKARYRRR